MRRSGKTLLAARRLGSRPVVVKLLLDGDEFWKARRAAGDEPRGSIAKQPPAVDRRRMHRELPEGPMRTRRLALLVILWEQARDRLHAAVRKQRA